MCGLALTVDLLESLGGLLVEEGDQIDELGDKIEADGRLYRLIGVGLRDLESADNAPQADLFGAEDELSAVLEKTVDGLRDRFGDAAPFKGRSLSGKRT